MDKCLVWTVRRQWVRHGFNKKTKNSAFHPKYQPPRRFGETHRTRKAMETIRDSAELTNRVLRLEEVIRAQNDLIVDLTERIGETFAKQAFSVRDLTKRWQCSETCVRRIVESHKLKLLRGPNGLPRSPIAVVRSSVLDYENGNTLLKFQKRRTKPAPSWAENPFLSMPKLRPAVSDRRVRRLGDPICESAQEKSPAHKKA